MGQAVLMVFTESEGCGTFLVVNSLGLVPYCVSSTPVLGEGYLTLGRHPAFFLMLKILKN